MPEPISIRRRPWPADYPERARELHTGGLSCTKVAEKLGVPFTTAKSWIWPESQMWAKRKAAHPGAFAGFH